MIVLCGCQPSITPITEQEKEEIISEITRLWETSDQGIEQHDARQAFSVFSEAEGVKYVRKGYIYQSIDTARNQYATWFKNPDIVNQKYLVIPPFKYTR